MSDTVIDFGGFTVDVSKIQSVHHEGFAINPKDYTAITFLSDGCGRSVAFGYKTAPTIVAAYEKHKANNLADGWYWASSETMKKYLIRVKNKMVSSTEPAALVDVTCLRDTSWLKFEPADPLSPEFLHAVHNNGKHPAGW